MKKKIIEYTDIGHYNEWVVKMHITDMVGKEPGPTASIIDNPNIEDHELMISIFGEDTLTYYDQYIPTYYKIYTYWFYRMTKTNVAQDRLYYESMFSESFSKKIKEKYLNNIITKYYEKEKNK